MGLRDFDLVIVDDGVDEYSMLIYNRQVSKLVTSREYTKLRHSVTNWIKQNIGDFKKW